MSKTTSTDGTRKGGEIEPLKMHMPTQRLGLARYAGGRAP
jgi:hypothetical protein